MLEVITAGSTARLRYVPSETPDADPSCSVTNAAGESVSVTVSHDDAGYYADIASADTLASVGDWQAVWEWIKDSQVRRDVVGIVVIDGPVPTTRFVSLAQVFDLGYDETVLPTLDRAETRVRAYLANRASALTALSLDTAPDALAEVICAVAYRMAKTADKVASGVQQSQGSDGTSLTWGAQAYAGISGLNAAEKEACENLFPRIPFSVDVL